MDQPQPLQPASSPVPTPTFTPSEQNPIVIDHKHRPIVGGAFIIIVLTLSIFVGGLLFANYWPNTDEPVVVTTPTPSASAAGVPADWESFSSKYFTLSFKVPPGFVVDEGPNTIQIAGPQPVGQTTYYFFQIWRYTGQVTKSSEIEKAKTTLKNVVQDSLVIDGTSFIRISGNSFSTINGKVEIHPENITYVFLDASSIIILGGNSKFVGDQDAMRIGTQILSTFKFTSPTSAVPADWKTYTNTQYGFEFRYPGDWSAPVPEGGIPMNFGLYLGPLLDAEGKGVQQFYVSIGALTYPSGGRAGAVTMDQLLIGLKANSSTSNIQDYMTRDGNRVITWEESDICKFAWAALQKLDSSDGVNIIGRCTTVSNPIFQGILSTFKFTK